MQNAKVFMVSGWYKKTLQFHLKTIKIYPSLARWVDEEYGDEIMLETINFLPSNPEGEKKFYNVETCLKML